MSWLRRLVLVVAVGALFGLSGGAAMAAGSGVPHPIIPKALHGKHCLLPNAEMIREHPDLLMDQRDAELRDGVRTGKYDLRGCIYCHATKDPATGKFITANDPRHFCDTCHTFVGVHPDCWECHSSVPAGTPASDIEEPKNSVLHNVVETPAFPKTPAEPKADLIGEYEASQLPAATQPKAAVGTTKSATSAGKAVGPAAATKQGE